MACRRCRGQSPDAPPYSGVFEAREKPDSNGVDDGWAPAHAAFLASVGMVRLGGEFSFVDVAPSTAGTRQNQRNGAVLTLIVWFHQFGAEVSHEHPVISATSSLGGVGVFVRITVPVVVLAQKIFVFFL